MKTKTPFQSIAMLLQGGGALGAYQAGVYQALYEAELEPDWVAGISIGAINAAIIAGNFPQDRVRKLREFWEGITSDDLQYVPPSFEKLLTRDENQHQALNLMSTMRAYISGISGFFKPRPLNPWMAPKGTLEATSFYTTSELKTTLEKVIDFDLLNSSNIKFNVGAVNVTSGDFISFDKVDQPITVEHIMASGALPPGLPAIKIGKDYYWDAGLISNTPLQWLLEEKLTQNTLVFQIDLWSADGEFPQNMAEVFTREKDIRYSSRTRADTDRFRQEHKLRHAMSNLLSKLPEEAKHSPEAKLLKEHSDSHLYNIVHLIYHNENYEGYSKDCEFSRLSMEAHWQAGYQDTLKTLEHPEVLQLPKNKEGIDVFDFSRTPSRLIKTAAA